MENQGQDQVVDLCKETIARIDVLLAELYALTAAWKQKLEAATRLERREQPDPIPGLHDFIISVRGARNSVRRVLRLREAEAQAGAEAAAAAQLEAGSEVTSSITQEERDSKQLNVIQCCGLTPLQQQWDIIKRTRGLLAFRRRFAGKTGKLGPTIDAVVEDGTEWLRISTVTEKKLIYQLAQQGWHPDDSSDEEDGEDSDDSSNDDDDDGGIDIIKTTKQLVTAARTYRCNTRIPTIRLALPNLSLGSNHAIDKILTKVRNLGQSKKQQGTVNIIVDCAESTFLQQPIPPLEQAFVNLFSDTNKDRITLTVNLELTIILSLVSDIAHGSIQPQEWYSRQTLSHIEDEKHAPGVRLQGVYKALSGKRLQCTQEIAREVRNIVADLGTEATKARTLLYFGRQSMEEGFDAPCSPVTEGNGSTDEHGPGSAGQADGQELLEQLRKLSAYPVPDGLQLPIEIIGDDVFNHKDHLALIEAGKLPPVAAKVWTKLDRPYNRSCYLWGWLQDITTMSANNLNTRLIDATVDKERSSALDVGPRLYLSTLAISINTARPCPMDKWDQIKDAKHERKEARTKEAKQMKAAGTWGPSLGIPVKWDEKQLQRQDNRRKKGGVSSGTAVSPVSSPGI
ncbi:hypothetical protein BD289DRAFT_53536 [Coniella lustricola]|uniref:DUF1308 domain-containing protein n=1 Tax=Coniella lustricola TaxID=2025994 RepID=A0A2T3A134_9PEZI|nr:hypothetical protein BD289DRAFT_53536 [Coniella lustricola]